MEDLETLHFEFFSFLLFFFLEKTSYLALMGLIQLTLKCASEWLEFVPPCVSLVLASGCTQDFYGRKFKERHYDR